MEKQFVVMIAESGTVSWLMASTDLGEAQNALAEWMEKDERDEEDFAWITEAIDFRTAPKRAPEEAAA